MESETRSCPEVALGINDIDIDAAFKMCIIINIGNIQCSQSEERERQTMFMGQQPIR